MDLGIAILETAELTVGSYFGFPKVAITSDSSDSFLFLFWAKSWAS